MASRALTIAAYLALGGLAAWRVYSRIRRAVGPQRLTRYRAPIVLGIYGLILALIVPPLLDQPLRLAALGAFGVAGAALAVVALRRTRFEAKPGALLYTPYTPISLAVAAIFIARMAWRGLEMLVISPGAHRSLGEFAKSPLTLGAFGLLAGYNIWYAIELARWRHRVLAERLLRETRRASPPGDDGEVASADRRLPGGHDRA